MSMVDVLSMISTAKLPIGPVPNCPNLTLFLPPKNQNKVLSGWPHFQLQLLSFVFLSLHSDTYKVRMV